MISAFKIELLGPKAFYFMQARRLVFLVNKSKLRVERFNFLSVDMATVADGQS